MEQVNSLQDFNEKLIYFYSNYKVYPEIIFVLQIYLTRLSLTLCIYTHFVYIHQYLRRIPYGRIPPQKPVLYKPLINFIKACKLIETKPQRQPCVICLAVIDIDNTLVFCFCFVLFWGNKGITKLESLN